MQLKQARRLALAAALLMYARTTSRSLVQQHQLLLRQDPQPPLIHSTLKYTATGQLIAGSEFLLALVKPRLAARIARLLLHTPRDCRTSCRYGPHERNTLDVYGIDRKSPSRPVLVFMHGGAWSFGHKWQYALVGEYLATQGFVVAIVNYRTFPNGSVMDMVEDIESAVFWVAENCHSFGGDRGRLFLSGHSSGGHVGALALVNSALRLASNEQKEKEIANYVRGFIGLAAPYDISDHYIFESERVVGPFDGVHEISSMKPAMLGINNFKKCSPTALIAASEHKDFLLPPFYLLHGADDEVVPPSSSMKFAASLEEAGQTTSYYEISNCTHEEMVFAVMGDDVDCRENVVELLKRIISSRDQSDYQVVTKAASPSDSLRSRL